MSNSQKLHIPGLMKKMKMWKKTIYKYIDRKITMWYSLTCVVSDASNNARVAQWWSVSLPRRRSRVRSPSRAYFFCKNIGPVCNLYCMSFCEQDLCFCKERCKHLSNLLWNKRFGSQAPKVAFGRFDGKKVHRTFLSYAWQRKKPTGHATCGLLAVVFIVI